MDTILCTQNLYVNLRKVGYIYEYIDGRILYLIKVRGSFKRVRLLGVKGKEKVVRW